MAEKKFSELETAANLDGSEYAAVSQSQSGVLTSVKATLQAIANWVASGSRYASALNTQDKTLTGAINEVLADAGSDVSVTNTIPSSDETKRVATVTIDGTTTDINADDTEAILRRVFGEHTVEGNPVTFDAYLGLETVKSLTLTMNPIQEGTGDPSPSNIRPISGRDSVDVLNLPDSTYQSFFNGVKSGTHGFVDLGTLTYDRTTSGLFRTHSLGTDIKLWSTPSAPSPYILSDIFTAVDSGGINGTTSPDLVMAQSRTGQNASILYFNYKNALTPEAFKTAISGKYLIYELETATAPSYTPEQYQSLVTAFGGQTKTINFPSTIYGGTDEVVGGVGQSNMGMVDLGDLNWSYSASGYFTSSVISEIKIPATQDDMINAICSNYKQDTARRVYNGDSGDGCFAIRYGTGSLWVRDSAYTDAQTFKTAMSGVQLCYELAEPTAFSTTPTNIPLNKGNNVVSSDADDLELTYSVG